MEKGTKIFLGVTSTIAGLLGLGYLLTRGEGPECETDADCPTWHFCGAGGYCVPGSHECYVDAQCPSGQICRSGECVPATGELYGTITDCDSGSAIAGAIIDVYLVTGGFIGQTTTDSGGQFSMDVASDESYTVIATADDHYPNQGIYGFVGGWDASMCLEPGIPADYGSIHFRVDNMETYAPFPGITCYANIYNCTTDSGGCCNIWNLPPGKYTVDCDVPDGYYVDPITPIPREVLVVAGLPTVVGIGLFPD